MITHLNAGVGTETEIYHFVLQIIFLFAKTFTIKNSNFAVQMSSHYVISI